MSNYIKRNDTADYLNKEHKRNLANTKISQYNCGGFALGTYSWYRPYHCSPRELIDMIDYYFDEFHSFKVLYNI